VRIESYTSFNLIFLDGKRFACAWQKVPSIGHKILNIPQQILGELCCDFMCTMIILDENLPEGDAKNKKGKKQYVTRP
jgi:hypothetical protein